MPQLILLRHGESAWNKKNIFTGWIDIPLSEKGIEEALAAGKVLSSMNVDRVFTSSLIRGIMTAMLALAEHGSGKIPMILHPKEGKMETWAQCYSEKTKKELIPVHCAWQLNERMYGELQGKNKQEMKELYGEERVQIWRRSYDVAPPLGESLKQTAERTLPYFENEILPCLEKGENVLVAAHGNSLRSIVMKIENLSKEEVVRLEIPTGQPLFFDIGSDGVIKRHERNLS